MKKGLIALALGTFGLGISQFVMMGILPYIATDFHVGIAEAGHLISAYALGVCVGAPAVALFARTWKLRNILYLLMGIYSLSALMMAMCPAPDGESKWQFTIALIFRFLQGTPHGAFFGVGSMVGGNFLGGKLSDKFGPGHTGRGILIVLVVSLVMTFLTAHIAWCAIPLMMVNTA